MTPYYMPPQDTRTSVFYAFDYLIGLVVFGFLYGILNLIVFPFANLDSSDSLHDYVLMIWYGALVVYLVFGPFWFWNKLKEWR